jgi:uncharacterized protein with HEPN domain
MKRLPQLALFDILDAITHLESNLENVTFEQFLDQWLVIRATERALEIISEASRRIPEELKHQHPNIPWGDIAGIGRARAQLFNQKLTIAAIVMVA